MIGRWQMFPLRGGNASLSECHMTIQNRQNNLRYSGSVRLTANVVRTVALGGVVVVALYLFLRPFTTQYYGTTNTKGQFLGVFSRLSPESWRARVPRVMKVTSLFGADNDLFDGALRSHEEHNRSNGYELLVFRRKIVENYRSMPTYLLSIIVEQLAKPEKARVEWVMWIGPSMMVLNPQIPLEIFLPPEDFGRAAFLGTQVGSRFDPGAFFARVHERSVKMLLEVLSVSKADLGDSLEASREALEKVLRSDEFRENVLYQPKGWYNPYQFSTNDSQARPGNLMVHFTGLSGEKWRAMADWISQTPEQKRRWSMSVHRTNYEKEVREY